MIDIFSVKTWEFSDKEKEARSKAVGSEAVEAEAVRPEAEAVEAVVPDLPTPPPTPSKPKKSFYDIALQIVGKQSNGTRSALIAEMMQKYSISETRANDGFQQLIDSKVIELQTNVNRYYMTDSTPF